MQELNTTKQLQQLFNDFLSEDTKFNSGNGAAGTRARKALQEMTKLIKQRRTEITEEKNTRKESKAK